MITHQRALLCTTILCLAGAAAIVHAAMPTQASKGRIDVTVDGASFDLLNPRGSPRAVAKRCSWLGRGREKTGVSCEIYLGRQWQELWVQFEPAQDGRVTVQLQGEWYPKQDAQDVRLVWVDDVTVEGASLQNGGFEDAGPDGRPAGWRVGGDSPVANYSRDGSVAHGGKACLAVWYDGAARQSFDVRAGQTYRVRAWFRVLDPARHVEVPPIPPQYGPRMYEQEVVIELASPEAAARAKLEVAPLYDDLAWAVSGRWDDCNPAHRTMREVLARHGYKATWYLNWGADFAPVARELLAGGNSIGGHGLTHPELTYLSRNRMFEEMAGVRAEWEAAADTQVLSYAFSFCDFTHELEGPVVQADITGLLERAGYYHVANGWYHDGPMRTEMILSPLMPWDGADIDDYAAGALAAEWFRQDHPNLSFAMHSWYRTPQAWQKFERQLDDMGGKADWWYCNQNQYAAYRYQLRHTRLQPPRREGNVVRVRLERPELSDVNDPVPVTLRVTEAPASDVRAVLCETADCTPSRRKTTSYLFHLAHDRDRSLPAKVGIIRNTANAPAPPERADTDGDFPGIGAWLRWDKGVLRLSLTNKGTEPLRAVLATYRVPLGYAGGVRRQPLGELAAGQMKTDTWMPSVQADVPKAYRSGSAFFVAQVDFVRAGQAGRLHVCCTVPAGPRDSTYPQGGFARLGPMSQAQFDLRQWTRLIRAGGPAGEPIALADGQTLTWSADDRADMPPYLSPEVVRTTGSWEAAGPLYYVLASDVASPTQRQVEIIRAGDHVQQVFLNGRPVEREPATLKQGTNRLVLIYHTTTGDYNKENAGCFLRLADPQTGAAVDDIRYEPVRAQPPAAGSRP